MTRGEVKKIIKAAKTAIRIGRSQSQNTTLQRSKFTTLQQRTALSKELSLRALSVSRFFPVRDYAKLVEPIQIVHYKKNGGHGCHSDTGESADPKNRMISISVVLKRPKAGGKMVFPGADIDDMNEISGKQWSTMQQKCEPINKCTSTGAGISALPKKGDAIIWYNMDAARIKENPKKEAPKKSKNDYGLEEEEAPVPTFKIPRNANLVNAYHCDAKVTAGEKLMANIYLNLGNSVSIRKSGKKKKKKSKKKKKKKSKKKKTKKTDL